MSEYQADRMAEEYSAAVEQYKRAVEDNYGGYPEDDFYDPYYDPYDPYGYY